MQTRGDFLTTAGALAALAPTPGATPQAGAPPAPPSMEEVLPRGFDLATFDAALSTPAKHKHLFACITEATVALSATRSTLNAYHVLGVPASAVAPAVVFYHGVSVLYGFDDAMWSRYVIPTNSVPASDSKAKLTSNPILKKKGGDWDGSVPALIASANAHFFICNLATHGHATLIAKQLHLPAKDVYEDLASHLIPNAMLVPAGVWAIHAIQERQYTLLQFA
ncbi:MAG TPA: hypothetical protein VKR56_02930 [Candidatus Cybelea sp.]|nr:hypothetical protein [Candidatus Cybelea sp.]